MKIRYTISIAALFVAAGLLIGYGPYMQYRRDHQTKQLTTFAAATKSGSAVTAPVNGVIEGTPVRIHVPSLAIDLDIINGYYNQNNKTWTLTRDMAQYATITPKANNTAGNTFIYGHDIQAVFARLNRLKAGDQVIVYTDNGHHFTYNFRSSIETTPYDDSLFAYKGAPILTLQTCSGIWSQNRQLFTFDLVGVV